MPPKGKPPPPPEPEPEVDLKHLTPEEKQALFLKKLPDLKVAGDAPAIKAIIEGMKEHAAIEQIQVLACRQLSKLASLKDASVVEKRELIRKAGGIEIIIKALEKHSATDELHKEAAAALCNMTNTHNNLHLQQFGDKGGIERIIKAMHTFKADREMQTLSCHAVHNLAAVSFNAEKIAAACGIERVITALASHEHLDIQLHGCGALQVLSISAENRSRIVEAGGIERLISAMIKYHDSIKMAEFCCGALVNVGCATPKLKGALIASRGAQGVRDAMQRAMKHP